jgi:hypothetical protein
VAVEVFTPAGLIVAALLTACAASDHSPPTTAQAAAAGSGLDALDPTSLVVTSGAIKRLNATRFETSSGAMRATLAGTGVDAAELRFHYLGPNDQNDEVPLASGELRRQVGLKLRAQDGCNVVYVMWRIEPPSGLNVSVKSNPDKHESRACADAGYSTVQPREQQQVQTVEVNSEHTLRASISGTDLQVYADAKLSWLGALPPEAFDFDGPAGIRSDNGAFDMEFRVSRSMQAARQ